MTDFQAEIITCGLVAIAARVGKPGTSGSFFCWGFVVAYPLVDLFLRAIS